MELRGLNFDGDRIETEEAPKLRSRIKENFTYEELKEIYNITMSHKFANNNDKVDALNFILRNKGFRELGAGTNRYSMEKDGYCYKFALDHFGFDDNNREFEMCKVLLPYVTKTYETNGLIAVCQTVNVIDLNTFHLNEDTILGILGIIAERCLFDDLGYIDKNFRNWGYDDNDNLIILDYGYTYERDDVLCRCTKCNHRIEFNRTYSHMECKKCGTKYRIQDIKDMLEATDEQRAKLFEKKEKVKISINPYKFEKNKDEESIHVSVKSKKDTTMEDMLGI